MCFSDAVVAKIFSELFILLFIPFFKKKEALKVEFPGGSEVKASACNAGDLGSIPGSGRSPGKGNGNPTPVFLPGESHGQRSLAGYSPQGHKESDTTERLHSLHSLNDCVPDAAG